MPRGRKLVVQIVETFKEKMQSTFVERLDAWQLMDDFNLDLPPGPLGAPAAGPGAPPGVWAKTVEAVNKSPSKDISNFEGIFSSFKNYK